MSEEKFNFEIRPYYKDNDLKSVILNHYFMGRIIVSNNFHIIVEQIINIPNKIKGKLEILLSLNQEGIEKTGPCDRKNILYYEENIIDSFSTLGELNRKKVKNVHCRGYGNCKFKPESEILSNLNICTYYSNIEDIKE